MNGVYLNEWDDFPAAGLAAMYPNATVDTTSIVLLNRTDHGPHPAGVPVDVDLARGNVSSAARCGVSDRGANHQGVPRRACCGRGWGFTVWGEVMVPVPATPPKKSEDSPGAPVDDCR